MSDKNMTTRGERRAVSICFVDFRTSPQVIRDRFPNLNANIRKTGERRGSNQIVPYNFVAFWLPMNALVPWDGYIEQLVGKLGGWSRLKELVVEISPREAWLRIDAPLLGSPYVETNGMSATVIAALATAGLAFELGVREYDENDPTHQPIKSEISTSRDPANP